MSDVEANIQAYRIMAEVLVNLRRIMMRGLHKILGESWWEAGCPSQVHQRLVDRRETEMAIERTAVDVEDLMAFATFGDMAEIIDHNDELAHLLKRLAPSRKFLSARLSELEALCCKLASARPFTEGEFLMLTNYHMKLRQLVEDARQRPRTDESDEGDERVSGIESQSEAGAEPHPIPASKSEKEALAAEAAPAPDEIEVEPDEPWDPSLLDDSEILRILRHEIVSAADAAFRHAEEIETAEWARVKESGWFNQRVKDLELEPIAAFYQTIEGYLDLRKVNATDADLDEFLTRTELSRVLLTLRDLFNRRGV